MAAAAFKKLLQVSKGTAAAAGGTFTADFPIPTDRVVRAEVYGFLTAKPGGSIIAASMFAEGVYANAGGTVSAVTAFTGGANPQSAAALVGSRAQASDAAFTGGGGTPPTLVLSVSSTNVRATITNNSASAQAADATIYFECTLAGTT